MKRIQPFAYEEIHGLRSGYAPLGNPNMWVNIFFIDGLLIDTGQANMRKSIIEAVRHMQVNQLFITHHHEDHSGNIAPLQKLFNCPVYGSKRCATLMKKPPSISLAQKLVWGSRPAYSKIATTTESIHTPHHCFKLIDIPGHAADMMALYEPNKKWLIAADLFIHTYIGYMLKNESIAQQINSIKKVLSLDFEVLFCSHNPPTENGRELLNKKLTNLEIFFAQVALEYKKGHNAKEIYSNMKLKEHGFIQWISGGQLSKLNMVASVIRDLQNQESPSI